MVLSAISAAAFADAPVAVDLLRLAPDHPRIFVQADLPSGRPGLFLVDTGADISAISGETAAELGLEITVGCGELSGLSGRARMDCASLPEIRFSGLVVPDVQVAVDVPGLTTSAGFMPLDGLLGNNVWGRFLVELDIHQARLVLHAPDAVKAPRFAESLHFDGHHVYTPMTVWTAESKESAPAFVAQVDTGASGLKVCATTGAALGDVWTEGLESLRGIGASETLPPVRFLETTRRIPIDRVALGGRKFAFPDQVQWLSFDDKTGPTCPSGIRALLGFEYLAGHHVFFGYASGHLWFERNKGKPRYVDGHTVLLDQDVARFGTSPQRALLRSRLLTGAGREDEALALLQGALADDALPEDDEADARVLAAELLRGNGDLAGGLAVLAPLSPAQLVESGELVGSVNGMVFGGRVDDAMELARAAVLARPDDGWAHVALADALLAAGDANGAGDALATAVEVEQYDDAHLLRRARVALAEGDRYAAMSHLRRLLDLYPFGGTFLWFYALLLETDADRDTFRQDMEAALTRLHPPSRPVDFEVAALHEIGDQDAALARMAEGTGLLCGPLPPGPELDNCLAWFHALAGVELEDAVARINRALSIAGDRADFLDTAAMVHLARGEWDDALDNAQHAARLSPNDVYMVWQAERISDLVKQRSGGSLVVPAN